MDVLLKKRPASVWAGWWLVFIMLSWPGWGRAGEDPALPPPLVVVMLRDFPPLYQLDEQGRPSGFSADIIRQVARRMGREVQFTLVNNWAESDQVLREGRADLMPAVGIIPERKQEFLFTEEVETVPVVFIVRASSRDIKSAADLKGRLVAVLKEGAASAALAREHPEIPMKVSPTLETSLFQLLAGEVDAAAYPGPVFLKKVREVGLEEQIRVVEPLLLELKRGMMLSPRAQALLEPLNLAIHDYTRSPDYQEDYLRWHGKPQPYWTVARLFWVMSGLIALVAAVLLVWHTLSVQRLNRRLRENITQLVATQAQLQLTQFAMDKAADMIVCVDERGRMFYFNEAARSFLGYDSEELEGLEISRIDLDIAQDPRRWALQGRVKPVRFETRCRRKNNTHSHVEVFLNEVHFQGRDLLCAFCREIEERKRLEAELIAHRDHLDRLVGERTTALEEANLRLLRQNDQLQQSEERFRVALEEAGQGMALVAPDGRWLKVNRALCDMVGYDQAELLASNDQAITHPDDLETDFKVARDLLDGVATSRQWEKRYLHKEGQVIWILITVTLVRDAQGAPVHFVTQILDITERKQALRAVQRAMEEADKANQAKSAFLATMSHEIRTPLNTILGMGEVLREGPLNREQQGYLQTLSRAGETLLALVNDILDLSKIEAGQFQLDRVAFHLPRLVEETLGLLSLQAKEKGLSLSWQLGPRVPIRVAGDPSRLRQVLLNLLANAVKFTDQGGITVSLEAKLNNTILFAVEDSGMGIAADKTEAVFQPFTQADSSITRHYGGTGLGLAICRRLVDRMQGHIWVRSTPGLGSTFYFTCLLPPTEEAPATPVPAVTWSGAEVMVPATILLADDSLENRQLVEAFLKNTPHFLEVAENGAEALMKMQSSHVDIVFMDLQMPIMDGLAATKEYRRWERGQSRPRPVPIIALSAHALREYMDKAREAGCDDYLSKPIRKQRFLEMVERHLAAGEGGTEGTSSTPG